MEYFSPSEAGAVGAFISFLIILGRKGFAVKSIVESLKSTAKTTAMIFVIVIGAMIFGDFMTTSNMPNLLVKFIEDYSLSPLTVVFILMVIYVILGALMDELAIMLITIPVIFPAITAFRYRPGMVWDTLHYQPANGLDFTSSRHGRVHTCRNDSRCPNVHDL